MTTAKWAGSVVVLTISLFAVSCGSGGGEEVMRLRGLLAQGREAEVREAARKLSLDPPRTVADRRPLARLLIDVDLPERAVAILREERLDAAARDVLALAYVRTGDLVRAHSLLDEQFSAETTSALTYRVQGELLLRERSWREARTAISESMLRDADDPMSAILLAATHLQETDVKTAERILRDAYRRFPHDAMVKANLAEVVLSARPQDRGALLEVARLLHEVVKLRPLNEGYRERLAVALMSLDELREAQVQLEELTETWPSDPGYWNRLGLVKRRRGDLPGSVEAFDRALGCSTKEGREGLEICLNLGHAQLEMADRTEEREKWGRAAWQTFSAASKIAANDARVYAGLARSTVEMDPTGEQVRAAVQLYEKALGLTRLGPYPPEVVHGVHLNMALLYLDLWIRDREEETEGRRKAMEHFRAAEKLLPTERWHESAAIAYRELQEAVRESEKEQEKESGAGTKKGE